MGVLLVIFFKVNVYQSILVLVYLELELSKSCVHYSVSYGQTDGRKDISNYRF